MSARGTLSQEKSAASSIAVTGASVGRRPASLASFPVNAYVRADHDWAGRREVTLAELVEHDLLVPTSESHARRAFDAAVETAGLPVYPAPTAAGCNSASMIGAVIVSCG